MAKIPVNPGTGWLVISGWMSAAAALLHVGCILGGPDWYRFLGAGERMAQMAERGHWYPPVITLIITGILAGWAAYAFSAAGKIVRLPLIRTALVLISAVLLLRALAVFIPSIWAPEQAMTFRIWSSGIVLFSWHLFHCWYMAGMVGAIGATCSLSTVRADAGQ